MNSITKISDSMYELSDEYAGHLYPTIDMALEDYGMPSIIRSRFIRLKPGESVTGLNGFLLVDAGSATIEGELASGYKVPSLTLRQGYFYRLEPSTKVINLEDTILAVFYIWYSNGNV